MNPSITVASATNERYSPGLEVMLCSLLQSNLESRFRFLIIADELSPEIQDRICQNIENHAADGQLQSLDFMAFDASLLAGVTEFNGSLTAYARIFLPQQVSDSSIYYVDADVFCHCQLPAIEQMEQDFPQAAIAGVIDPLIQKLENDYPSLVKLSPDLQNSPYLNTGVLWMNLDQLRKMQFTQQALELIKQGNFNKYADQTLFNYLCVGRIALMDESYNLLLHYKTIPQQLHTDCNFHFIGKYKPFFPPNAETDELTCLLFKTLGSQIDLPHAFPESPHLDLKKSLRKNRWRKLKASFSKNQKKKRRLRFHIEVARTISPKNHALMTASKPKQILCIKWGTVYGAKDVNILYAMIARNITGPFKLYCFTDDATGVREEVTCLPLPELGCEIPPDVPGKWPKTALWGRELFGLEGVALFVDLDSVIVGNLDDYFTHGDPEQVYTARNWMLWWKRTAQTSVFRFKIGANPYMLEDLQADPAGISRKYRFEQNYVNAHVNGGVKFWPEPWTKHFRIHSMGNALTRYFRKPILPQGAKIITFPGLPKPADAALGRWSEKSAIRTPKAHIAWVWEQFKTGKKWRRHLSRFIQKADWLHEVWRE